MGVRIIIYLCFVCYFLQHMFYPIFDETFGLSYIGNDLFSSLQLISYGFLHVDISHICINLIVFYIFGTKIDSALGCKNFIFLFLFSVLGGSLFQTAYLMFNMQSLTNSVFPVYDSIDPVADFVFMVDYGLDAMNLFIKKTIGASAGAFGCVTAFTILFPKERLQFFLLPISISARWFAVTYVAIEIYNTFFANDSNIAHFAHLGGALFGLSLALYWRKQFNI